MTKDLNYIYEKYSKSVYRYLILLTKDKDLSEDLTQETFLQAFKSIDRFTGDCSIYTWLCAIAKNLFKVYIKKNNKYVYYDDIENLPQEVPKEINGIYAMISNLQSPYREIVQLHIYDEISLKEIGERLGKSESYARVMFHRAKNMLRKEIKKDEM